MIFSAATLLLGLPVAIGSGLVFVRWLYVSIGHESVLTPGQARYRPRDLIWAYVIPFANLVRPYEVIRLSRLVDATGRQPGHVAHHCQVP